MLKRAEISRTLGQIATLLKDSVRNTASNKTVGGNYQRRIVEGLMKDIHGVDDLSVFVAPLKTNEFLETGQFLIRELTGHHIQLEEFITRAIYLLGRCAVPAQLAETTPLRELSNFMGPAVEYSHTTPEERAQSLLQYRLQRAMVAA